MQENKSPSGWDRIQGLFFGVMFCGFTWIVTAYLLPLALAGQGWVPPGTGAWGGVALIGMGALGLILVAAFRKR